MRLLAFLCAPLLLLSQLSPGHAQGADASVAAPADAPTALAPAKKSHLVPSLVANTSTVAPGKPFLAGLHLKMDPGWHTYWQFPGDAGLPVSVEWTLPAGFQAGPIQWPLPHTRMDEGDLLSNVYEEEVLLLVEITPPAELPAGEITLQGHVKWQVCEKTCIPGEGDVSIKLTRGDAATPANAELFAKWRAALPRTSAPPFEVQWQLAEKEAKVKVSGLPAEAKLEFFPLPPEGVTPDHPAVSAADGSGARTITLPISGAAEEGTAWRALLVTQLGGGPREGWIVAQPAGEAGLGNTAAGGKEVSLAASGTPKKRPAQGLLQILLLAFAGGMILNVMPCVLPVIALKIFGFVNQAGEDPRRVRRLGWAFVGGVFVFFLGLATAVSILGQAFSWGFQFSSPPLLAGLIALVFVFGLNLLGVFEIALPSSAATTLSDLSAKEGYKGAFLHGLFTTLLGTSCTAPILAPALGFAVTQPAPVVFLIFLVVAAGLATPYLLLTSNPAWLRYVPKPGAWMERFKQVMGFIMLAVAVWLFTVFAGFGAGAVEKLAWYLFLLAIASWLFGTLSTVSKRPVLWWRVGMVSALFLIVGGYFTLLHGQLQATEPSAAGGGGKSHQTGSIAWQPFSEEAVAEARKANRPVFIDFTADWCLNCKFFERTVLAHDSVGNAMREHGVVTLKADWTRQDPKITKWLNQFDRVGVPLYVLYRPGETDPVVEDAITRQSVIDALKNTRSAK